MESFLRIENFNEANLPALIGSDLIIYNYNSDFLQLYEIQYPYMVIVQDYEVGEDICHFGEYAPGKQVVCTAKLSDYIPYKQRPLHQHNFFETMIVLSGSVTHRVGNKVFIYREGQCCIMNRNVKHCEEFTSDFKAVFLSMRADFLQRLIEQDTYYTADGFCHRFQRSSYQLFLENGQDKSFYEKVYLDFSPVNAESVLELLNPLISQIIGETVLQKAGSAHIIAGLFSRLFSILEDDSLFCSSRVQSDSGMQEYLFTKVAHILEVNKGRISREELEHLLNYNGEYLNRIVKKFTGMNLTEYGRTFLLKEARKLLTESDRSITDIISELGFANRSHFYQIFEKEYGITPNEFRKENCRIQ
ncbi:MAG TPA: AraC family transcriptional regulator [Clostridiales bacterium]|nr:AraC family transcriptional regulator [Clostridiales bacterium]